MNLGIVFICNIENLKVIGTPCKNNIKGNRDLLNRPGYRWEESGGRVSFYLVLKWSLVKKGLYFFLLWGLYGAEACYLLNTGWSRNMTSTRISPSSLSKSSLACQYPTLTSIHFTKKSGNPIFKVRSMQIWNMVQRTLWWNVGCWITLIRMHKS